jgi:hypothetical protein
VTRLPTTLAAAALTAAPDGDDNDDGDDVVAGHLAAALRASPHRDDLRVLLALRLLARRPADARATALLAVAVRSRTPDVAAAARAALADLLDKL